MKLRKFVYCVAALLLTFICIDYVEAKTCEYNYKGKLITITPKKNEQTNEITIDYKIEGKYNSENSFIDTTIFDNEDQCLETLTVCVFEKNQFNTAWEIATLGTVKLAEMIAGERHIALFGSALDPSTLDNAVANEFDDISKKGFWESWFWTGESESCSTADYVGEDKAEMKENGNFINYCSKFVSMYSDIANAYQEYGKCVYDTNLSPQAKSRCKANAFTEVNKYTDKLKDTCNNILQNSNINVKDGCASSCLGANDTLKTLKEKYGLEVTNVNECSFSSRLVIWIANIIRWVKYIIPVVVIVLSILDFIKAIGGGKDDEMKKAQGKFIRRLIAAALIFIAPFIIQFVLEKMGFAANGCGIIDL